MTCPDEAPATGAIHGMALLSPNSNRGASRLELESSLRYISPDISHEKRIMKLSARNQLKGKIIGVIKGATAAHVRIDIGNGVIVTSSIPNEAVNELKLKTGDKAIAVIKVSDVMVAK